jgi:3-hydroxyacyl-CoA dehydrogenase
MRVNLFKKSFQYKRNFSFSPVPRDNIVVVGGGLMGSGIVQVAAELHKVTLVDLNQTSLDKCMKSITSNLERVAKKKYATNPEEGQAFVSNTLKNIQLHTDVNKVLSGADLVVEAIVEKLEAKQKFFASIDGIAPANTIFASNTSSFSVLSIAEGCTPQRKTKFGGLHFFNPVPVMKLVEVIKTSETAPQTHQYLLDFCTAIHKTPITCKDTPGFVVNRLLCPYIMEAVRLFERGVSSKEDIDVAMKLGTYQEEQDTQWVHLS